MPDLEIFTPDWWLQRLYEQVRNQQQMFQFFNDYYIGDHPLPWLPEQAKDEFRRLLGMTRSNYMGLVCDAVAERVAVEGFRFGEDTTADSATWRIFQANNMDKDSDLAWLESLIGARSFFLVEPNRDEKSLPHIYVEHSTQATVEHVPGTNRRQRKAGLKLWQDDWTGKYQATLYLIDEESKKLVVYKYQSRLRAVEASPKPKWEPREGEEFRSIVSELDVIPLIEVPNNPRLVSGGVSELFDLTDIQDRINKTLADRLITQDFGAFPQKFATGWPEKDEDGNATPKIEIGRNRMITTEVQETEFGQFKEAELKGYSEAKREDVKDVASRSRTPAQYLLGELSNVNGETLKAAESGLVSKVKQRRRPWGEALEETMRLARRLAGLRELTEDGSSNEFMMEVIWSNPEYRTEGELVDAVVKKLQTRIASLRQAREDVGYSIADISRLEREDREQSIQDLEPLIQRALGGVNGNGANNGATNTNVQPVPAR